MIRYELRFTCWKLLFIRYFILISSRYNLLIFKYWGKTKKSDKFEMLTSCMFYCTLFLIFFPDFIYFINACSIPDLTITYSTSDSLLLCSPLYHTNLIRSIKQLHESSWIALWSFLFFPILATLWNYFWKKS